MSGDEGGPRCAELCQPSKEGPLREGGGGKSSAVPLDAEPEDEYGIGGRSSALWPL
ncbi:hypothetical protein [Gorillibacterium massiliense]|uniref:hypothetical protein n=1 Tax=Gorillibacterium massiliense TaxID=1280390 RepID=UPI0004AE2D47|nr:hypothetical protein [Gorillibacterium massiliense]